MNKNYMALSEFEADLAVNGVPLFQPFPECFTYYELTFFDGLNQVFFPNAIDTIRASKLCRHVRIIYIAIKMHLLTMRFSHSSVSHQLEMAVLNGDLLSSRFAMRLIEDNEYNMLKDWFDYLLPVFEQMTTFARQGDSFLEREHYHVKSLFSKMLSFTERYPESFGLADPHFKYVLDDFVHGFLTGEWNAFFENMPNAHFQSLILRKEADRSILLDNLLHENRIENYQGLA